MDAERLVEYNPLLAEIAPAARVAYAKFKIPKIKQEYEENTMGQDDVFENAPTVDIVDETKKSSIARPRPKSTRQSPVAGALPYPSTSTDKQPADSGSTKTADAGQQQEKTIQKIKTTELRDSTSAASVAGDAVKDPSEMLKKGPEQTKPEPGKSGEVTKDADGKSQPSTSSSGRKSSKEAEKKYEGSKKKDTGSTDDADKIKDADKPMDMDSSKDTDESKDTDKSKDTGKSEEKDKGGQHLKPESPKRAASPKKPGGKSKVTGEILTGWL